MTADRRSSELVSSSLLFLDGLLETNIEQDVAARNDGAIGVQQTDVYCCFNCNSARVGSLV